MNELNKLLELRSQNYIDLHVKKVEKSGTGTAIENSGYQLAGFDHFKSHILAEVRRVKYKHLQYIVYRIELTNDGLLDILDVKIIAG